MIFESEIKEYLIKRHQYYEVRYSLTFTDITIKRNFEKILKLKVKQIDQKHIDIQGGFSNSILSRPQVYFESCNQRNKESATKFKDRRNAYLYKTNYFIKKIDLDNKIINITTYIKPSASISQVLKGIKISINNWYFYYKIHDFKFPYTTTPLDERGIVKDMVFENTNSHFKVFNIFDKEVNSLQ
jgi:hypothetical protein